jgi:hypothetical protein
MFPKKILLSLINLNALKKGEASFIDVLVRVDNKNLEKLLAAGYDPMQIVSSLSYKYPSKYPGDKLLYLYLFAQDVLKGRFFNESRPIAVAMMKQKIYNVPLTEKEKQIYTANVGKEDEAQPKVEETRPVFTGKKIIAFTSTAPRIGKTTTVNNLVDVFEEKGYKVSTLTIAELIRTCLALVANLIGKDASRFFENYPEKDISKTFGNEEVPFKTRDLLCEFSIMIQKYYGVQVWGKAAAETLEETDANIIFIDDLRRKDELIALKEVFKEDLIVIQLDKEDVDGTQVNKELSAAAQAFESKLGVEDLDYQFTFNSDWSNTQDLVELIRKLVS